MNYYKTKWKLTQCGAQWIKEPVEEIANGTFFYDGDDVYVISPETMSLQAATKEHFETKFPEAIEKQSVKVNEN